MDKTDVIEALCVIAAFGLILWLVGCAERPDMSRDEAIGIIALDKEMRK